MPTLLLDSPFYTLADAFAYCDRLALRHYENFPVGSWMIPKAMRPYVHSIYAFARTADDYADEACCEGKGICSPEERIRLLDDWERQLEACYMGEASHPIFIALRETMHRFDMPIEPFKALLHAFRLDITVKRYPKFTDVLYYCNHSANPVGQLVLYLFGYRSPALHRLSDCICTALQLTNFWQDIAIDLEKDRVYIPQADLAAFGYSEEDLLARRFNRAFRQLLCYQIKRTYQLFAAGWPLCQQVRRMLGLELRVIWFGGVRILERIEQANYDVFSRRPTLSWLDRGLFLLRALTKWGNEPP